MLEYVKLILQKVSFDQQLFEKELRKSIKELIGQDLSEFKSWCYEQFGAVHGKVLNECFSRLNVGMA